ncbi:DUF6526 family protein [Negadavirga shengliensis]|uniref:DUF6526 family protein n=1 Tax=Negadavirga shengliensis TaxID=1389218 RepID=A0ABV9T8T8_9BACT
MQNYKNHRRYYPFHHYVITPLTFFFLSWSFWNVSEALDNEQDIALSIYFLTGAMILFFLPIIARIYALKNQNRTIRLEMRLRYFQLTGKPFHQMEKKLRLSQIVALRFAGSKELLSLMERAIKENLTPKEIKKSIKDWQSDNYRV